MKRKLKLKRKFIILVIFILLFSISKFLFIDDDLRNGKFVFYAEDLQVEVKTGNEVINKLNYLSKKDKRIETIVKTRDSYPEILLTMLSRNVDMTDYVFYYNEYKGKVFSDNIGEVTKGKYPLLLQYDKRWGYGNYGDSVIAISGCGPTTLSMVIAGLTGRNDITPYDVAQYSYKKGYYQNGTSWRLFTQGVRNYNIKGEEIPLSKQVMIDKLNNGNPIICSMKPGDFTTTGHLIVVTDYENGKFKINDPNSKERSSKLWSYEKIAPQIKNLWAFSKI